MTRWLPLFALCLLTLPALGADPFDWTALAEEGFELVVDKSERKVFVVDSRGSVRRTYPMGLGFEPVGDKEKEGDGRTPEGRFVVGRQVPWSQFHKAWLINYPLPEDADRGLRDGLIDEVTAERIKDAHKEGKVPPQHTALGGLIELHGGGGESGDWTFGCVALDDAVLDELWPHVKVGTVVTIRK